MKKKKLVVEPTHLWVMLIPVSCTNSSLKNTWINVYELQESNIVVG